MEPRSVLSDGTIRRLVDEGRLRIDPWDPAMVQPASVDLKLGPSFRVFHNHRIQVIDLADPPQDLTEHVQVENGDTFVIHPNEFVLGRTEEWVELPDDIVARIEGKALALDTPVPTPKGWTTMGDLLPGDEVFDPLGNPIGVLAATEPMRDRPCREVEFSDGSVIVADADHLWEVQTKYDRKRGGRRVLTTDQIAEGIRVPWAPTEYQYHVPVAEPVRYDRQELPIDPYVLGVWLGDGTSSTGEVTTADHEILEEIEYAGHAAWPASGAYHYRVGGAVRERYPGRDPHSGRFCGNGSLQSKLRELGLLNNKHIPRPYLEAGIEQRRGLLEGLMDTDGYIDKLGRCDLTTVDPGLAESYRELVASLGLRPIVAAKPAKLYGRPCGTRYEVTFTPRMPVFRLSRKGLRLDPQGRSHSRARAITAVREVPSVPVRCIEVGTERGAFLVGESFITTHNSSLGRLGLIVHATAGFVDPGWKGTLTLEITNFNSVPIVLRTGLPIAQLSLMALDAPAERPYGHEDLGSHYHGQVDATESRYEGGPAPSASARPAGSD